MNLEEVLKELKTLASPEVIKIQQRFGIFTDTACGILSKDLKVLAKKIGKNDTLAHELFETGIFEARLLVPLLFNPKNITPKLMDKWVKTFDNWAVCDAYCLTFFSRTPFAVAKIFEWIASPKEFIKRAGFACMAGYAMTNKIASNAEIGKFFPLIVQHAYDERKYVMKAVNWALRQIGKRNRELLKEAIEAAHQIKDQGSKPARWIAADALRELQSQKVCIRNYPRLSIN